MIIPLPAFKDNYIWVVRNEQHAAVIDPGDGLVVMTYLRQENLRLSAILATHHHDDHVGGNLALLKHFDVPVYGPARENIPGLSHPVAEGDTVSIPSMDLTVMEVPGHTSNHVAYYGAHSLFCGDTLFACGCGRIFEGTPKQMFASLQKIKALPDDTLVYCAHEYTLSNIRFSRTVEPGNNALSQREKDCIQRRKKNRPTLPSTLLLEKKTNPFLRCEEKSVASFMEKQCGHALEGAQEVFAELRKFKDGFAA